MDGLEIEPERLDDLNHASGWTHRKVLDPAPPLAEDREGFECST